MDYPLSSSDSSLSGHDDKKGTLPVQYGSGVHRDYDDVDSWESDSNITEPDVPELPPLEILEERLQESQSRNSRTLELTLRFTAPDPNGDDVSPIQTLVTAIKEIFR